jgi:hypothetical protein
VDNLRGAAVLKEELLKPVVLNYIKCHTKIKENRCGLYVSGEEVINYRGICDNRVAFTKTRLCGVDLSPASFVEGLKEEPLKDLTEHADDCDQTEVISITLLFRIFA